MRRGDGAASPSARDDAVDRAVLEMPAAGVEPAPRRAGRDRRAHRPRLRPGARQRPRRRPARRRRRASAPRGEHLVEAAHAVHVAAERAIVVERACVNSIGATIAGVGTEPKLLSGMRATSTITVMPPPGQT